MTIYDRATKLQLRLEAANAASAGHDLLLRGRNVGANLQLAAEYLEAAEFYRRTVGRSDMLPIDASAIRQAIGRFRGALSKSGPKAFQQQSAASLIRVLNSQTMRVERWVKSTWQGRFEAVRFLLDRAESVDLHGSPVDRIKARNRASTIRFALRTDPVKERAALEERLKVEGLNACLIRVKELIGELHSAILAIDKAQAALPPEVRAVLMRAASPEGLPLEEVTPKLLRALQATDVLDDLVVRQL